jgi:ketosteroid isomerase-like protein
MHRPSHALLLVAALAACNTSAEQATPATTGETKASAPAPITQQDVEKSTQDIVAALRAGDAAAVAQNYTAEGAFISARGKVEGTQAVQDFWAAATKDGAGKNLNINVLKWGTAGDLAWSIGDYTGGITAPEGNVLTVMQRQADGSLKVVAQASVPKPAAK